MHAWVLCEKDNELSNTYISNDVYKLVECGTFTYLPIKRYYRPFVKLARTWV